MSLIRKNALKKHVSAFQSTLGLSACCAILSSCGSGLPKSASSTGEGTPSMILQVDKWQNGTWEDVSSSTPYDLNCLAGNSDFKLRLLNSGTGQLKSVGTTVSISKTSDYAGGTMNGVAGDYTFTVQSQPSMPVAANSNSEFTVRLANSNGDCMLGGRGYNHEGLETALVTIHTDDPTNPTFNATLKVFGSS
ncbi:hypothetical protein D3C87_1608070 [compost metagenome]